MAVAITKFRAFCGFLPLAAISEYLSKVPELHALVPLSIISNFQTIVSDPLSSSSEDDLKASLQSVFGAIMKADKSLIDLQIGKLVERYREGKSVNAAEAHLRELVLSLHEQFPFDIGIFCVYLLNVVDLEPGQAIFLKADEPHAYIYGGRHPFFLLFQTYESLTPVPRRRHHGMHGHIRYDRPTAPFPTPAHLTRLLP